LGKHRRQLAQNIQFPENTKTPAKAEVFITPLGGLEPPAHGLGMRYRVFRPVAKNQKTFVLLLFSK